MGSWLSSPGVANGSEVLAQYLAQIAFDLLAGEVGVQSLGVGGRRSLCTDGESLGPGECHHERVSVGRVAGVKDHTVLHCAELGKLERF